MRIVLADQTQDRIHEALGQEVDLAPEAVPSVLARLAVEAPETYSHVLEELSGSQIRLDSEEELRRRKRRGALRRLFFGWGEYESNAGDRLLEKRHVAAAVPLALAAITMGLLAYSVFRGHPVAPPPAKAPAAAPSGLGSNRLASRLPALLIPRRAPAPRDDVATTRVRLSTMLPEPPLPAVPPLQSVPASISPRMGSPIVVSSETAEGRSRPATEPAPAASPVVYNRSADGAVDGDTPQSRTARPKSSSPAKADAAETPFHALAAGSRVEATLLTGAIVVAGAAPVPVIVESGDPRGLWVGQAALAPGDRIQLALSLSTSNRAEAAHGVALDPDRLVPGLQGRTAVRHSSSVAAMSAAALQAASDYAQAQARQGVFTVPNGFNGVVFGGQAPEAWTFLAARLAQEFQTRSTPGGWVTTTEVPAGTKLVILVTGAS